MQDKACLESETCLEGVWVFGRCETYWLRRWTRVIYAAPLINSPYLGRYVGHGSQPSPGVRMLGDIWNVLSLPFVPNHAVFSTTVSYSPRQCEQAIGRTERTLLLSTMIIVVQSQERTCILACSWDDLFYSLQLGSVICSIRPDRLKASLFIIH